MSVRETAEEVANLVIQDSERPLPLTAVDRDRVFVNWASVAYVEERRSYTP